MILAPCRRVILVLGQRLTAAWNVARASRRSFTPARCIEVRAGGVVPTIDRVGVVRNERQSWTAGG